MAARLVVTANQMIRLNLVGLCDGSGESLQGGRCKVILGGSGGEKQIYNQRWYWVSPDVGNRTLFTHRHSIFSEPHNTEIRSFERKSHSKCLFIF